MTIIIVGIACLWIGVFAWAVVATSRKKAQPPGGSRETLDRHMEVLRENHELIQRLAKAETEIGLLKQDLVDAYDVIAVQYLMFGPTGKKQKEAVH